ncbi:helix-turn-helix domain-containing protein [Agromyces sp. NPDC004153]
MKRSNPRATAAHDAASVAKSFDPERLRQARQLALKSKQDLASAIGVSPAAIGQFEAGVTSPRTELITALAKELDVPAAFFLAGRPQGRLESGDAFFRSLRSTTAKQRSKATAFTEQLWELINTLEKHIRLPAVDLPEFDPEPHRLIADTADRAARAAAHVRAAWGLGKGPIPQVVRTIEKHGIVPVFTPTAEREVRRIDAFSTLALGRPLIVLTPDRANDVYRHRFTAAHELGHLVLHGGLTSGSKDIEREADRFAAELLMPGAIATTLLPTRVDFRAFDRLCEEWGVSVDSLIYRSAEMGRFSDATARRAYIRLAQLRGEGSFAPLPVAQYPGENPAMLRRAVELAEERLGITVVSLAQELAWKPAQVRRMLGDVDERPLLTLV